LFCPTNVKSEEDVVEALKKTKSAFKKLDVVVNCAGIGVAYRTYNITHNRSHSLADFQKVIDTNVTGTFNVIRLGNISTKFSARK
jgi:3-hydroxyacyl-CoA dehydrogenase / 3-hydroxy-2-methylbutyryl-CoA dehydrogenase